MIPKNASPEMIALEMAKHLDNDRKLGREKFFDLYRECLKVVRAGDV